MTAFALARSVRRLLPLHFRERVAAWFAQNRWFPGSNRWSEGLIRDLEGIDPKRYHKFIWHHHLERYGAGYEASELFASTKLNGTARAYEAFVAELRAAIGALDGARRIDSVLDVGCSAGHVLRNLEREVFQGAREFVGVDIDRSATDAGRAFLAGTDSRIELLCGDLEQLEATVGDRHFDFSYAAGSLSYLDQNDAAAAVAGILAHTVRLAAFVGLAGVDRPNAELGRSTVRELGARMWAHDFEEMVRAEGWYVLKSRWEPPTSADRQGLYMVFARPPGMAG